VRGEVGAKGTGIQKGFGSTSSKEGPGDEEGKEKVHGLRTRGKPGGNRGRSVSGKQGKRLLFEKCPH